MKGTTVICVQVQAADKGDVSRVFISVDSEGARELSNYLLNLKWKHDEPELMIAEWGGDDLTSRPFVDGIPVVHHLTLLMTEDERGA